jgi:integrase
MEIKMSTTRYQEGSIERVLRAKGRPDVWVYRWHELQEDGSRVQRKKTIGDVEQFPAKASLKREVENLRAEIDAASERVAKITVADAWGHFQINELRDDATNRSEITISRYLALFEKNILPKWGKVPLDEVKTVQVEMWLRSLPHANGTRAKFRNVMCLLLNHAIR